jgi:hypothetical protein
LVLDVAGLLADQREASVGSAPTEHRLRCVPEEFATLTARSGRPQSVQIFGFRYEGGCGRSLVTWIWSTWISTVVH